MKCEKCGFILSKDFDKCPYCGTPIKKESMGALHKSISFGNKFSIRIKTFLSLLLINFFVIGLLVDWFLGFKYAITVFSYIFFIGGFLGVELIYRQSPAINNYERIDLFLLGLLLLLIGIGRIKGTSVDIRSISVAVIMPLYLVLSNIAMIFVLIFTKSKNNKLRPIITDYLVFSHFLISLLLFIFTIVNTYSNSPIFPYLSQYGNLSKAFCYIAFGFNALYFVNFNFAIATVIVSRVRYKYGRKQ